MGIYVILSKISPFITNKRFFLALLIVWLINNALTYTNKYFKVGIAIPLKTGGILLC
jgi:hypothetical protein